MESSPYVLDSSQTIIKTIKMGIYMLGYIFIGTGQLVRIRALFDTYTH